MTHHHHVPLRVTGGSGSGGVAGLKSPQRVPSLAGPTAELARRAAERAAFANSPPKPRAPQTIIRPVNLDERSGNELRPVTFDQMVGQATLKALLRRVVNNAKASGRAMDHMLLCGSAGTGKTTLAMVLAHELDREVYMLKAPVAQDVLEALARTARDGDVVIVDECHLWTKPDRRGVNAAASPEQVYSILEDQRLQTMTGVVAFPRVTFIGCTTTTGGLPEPFLLRFPLKPHLSEYADEEMATLASANARALGMTIEPQAASLFALACRRNPRQLNAYIRNARSLATTSISATLAHEVVVILNATTLDGLDHDMQRMLTFLLGQRRIDGKGNVHYQAGLGTIATALGKSRDSQAVALSVEPWLIKQGLLAVTPGGRCLTPAGVLRAEQL